MIDPDPQLVYVPCPQPDCRNQGGHPILAGEPNGDPRSADVAAACRACGQPFDVVITLLDDGETTHVEYR